MGKGLRKTLQISLSKIRGPVSTDHQRDSDRTANSTTTSSWLLSACKYPRTPSFTANRHHPNAHNGSNSRAATLSDVDCFLFENFNSLYASPDGDGAGALEDYLVDDCPSPPPADAVPDPDVRASPRFFVSPSTSSSLVDEARPSAASSTSSSYATSPSSTVTQPPYDFIPAVDPGDAVAVTTFSKDPYEDFRRSMQEMVESRHRGPREALDWDFMEDLLFCYLKLNDRSVHKYVLGAFTDLAVDLQRGRPSAGAGREIPTAGA